MLGMFSVSLRVEELGQKGVVLVRPFRVFTLEHHSEDSDVKGEVLLVGD